MNFAIPQNFENAATADGGIFALIKNGEPRESKGLAGFVLKLGAFMLVILADAHIKAARRALNYYAKL